MALDRWIALALLGVCLAYGYTAWFTMDDGLAPFMKRNPIWPSTFPENPFHSWDRRNDGDLAGA